MMPIPVALAMALLSFDSLRWDEQLALTALVAAISALTWAFAYTTSEGALRPQRIAFQRSADLFVLLGLYAIARIWL